MKGRTFKRCTCPPEYDDNGRRKACGKKHGTWSYVVDLGPSEDGKRQQRKRGGFATKAEAEEKLAEYQGQQRARFRIDDKLTVAQWLDLWLESKTSTTGGTRALSENTAVTYGQQIRDYLKPTIGSIPLAQLSVEDVEHAYREVLTSIRPGLKGSSMRRIHATLSSALNRAVKTRRMMFNPAAHVDLPDTKRPMIAPWQPAELGQFLDHVVTDRRGTLFETMAATGVRRGEALGIRWSDLDLERGVLVVRQQLLASGRFAKPKTKAGEDRVVELDSRTIGTLISHRFAQEAERTQWAEAYEDHDLVFAQPNGRPYDPSKITKVFSELCDVAGVRRVRLHDLRHGHASLMLAAGVPIELVSKRLGHSNYAITMDTYSHLLDGYGRAAAEKGTALVPRAVDPAVRDHFVTTPAPEADDPQGVDEETSPLIRDDAGAACRNRTDDLFITSRDPDVIDGDPS